MNAEIQPIGTQRPAAPVAPAHPHVKAPTVTLPCEDAPVEKVSKAQSRANIQEAIERLNRQMQDTGRNLNFSVDQASGRVVIVVKNTSTGEVVRQIPDESLLRVAHNIEDIKGLLHNALT
jgi:flagellar protein FlaG